jgi:hypothetical protein
MYLATSSAGRLARALMNVSKASFRACENDSLPPNASRCTASRDAFSSSSDGTISPSLDASVTRRDPVAFT